MRVSRVVVIALLISGCSRDRAIDLAALRYTPHACAVAITTVPLLVKEMAHTLHFLPADFSAGGVLAGKEVYAFSPSTVTVVAGDTVLTGPPPLGQP